MQREKHFISRSYLIYANSAHTSFKTLVTRRQCVSCFVCSPTHGLKTITKMKQTQWQRYGAKRASGQISHYFQYYLHSTEIGHKHLSFPNTEEGDFPPPNLWQINKTMIITTNKKMISEVISNFLNHSTTDIWGWITYCGGCPVHCRLFSSMPDTIRCQQNLPSHENKMSQTLLMSPGQNNPWLRISGLLLYGLVFKGRMRKVLAYAPIKDTEFSRLFTWAVWLF